MFTHARVAVATAMSAIGITAAVVTAPAAHADGFTITSHAEVTSTIKKNAQVVTFPTTTSTATITPGTSTSPARISAVMDLPAATTTMKLGRLDLVRVTMRSESTAPTTGTIDVDGPVWTIHATQKFRVRITKISPIGLPWINLVRPGCQTAETSAALTGTLDFSKGNQAGGPGNYWLRGTYTIPSFTGCGLLNNPLLTAIVSGPGNTLAAHFTG